ncbi:MAG: hypothetical protein GF400_06555 [Candidatus Eisenbacteria bacterium]|nr:hypothetical protein [Candidatus Eisenbacteria bacterium]
MHFTYRARDDSGSDVYGEIEARGVRDAESKIRELGLSPVEIGEIGGVRTAGGVPVEETGGYTRTRSDVGTGVAEGCATGWVLGIILVVMGLLLTFTGIGAIIGIPLIVAGIIVPLVAPFLGLSSIRGPCPYCGSRVRASRGSPGAVCPACGRRIVIRDGRYYRVG